MGYIRHHAIVVTEEVRGSAMPDVDKPAKKMLRQLNALDRGEKVGPWTGPTDGMSVNKALMVAVIKLLATGLPGELWRLLDGMNATGHLALRRGDRVACEQGANGAHWYFTFGALLAALRYCHQHIYDLLVNSLERRLLAERGLCRPCEWQGEFYVVGTRIKGKPVDGYRNDWNQLICGKKLRRQASYWQEDGALAVRTMRQLVESGLWGAELQAEARNAPLPKLYLPMHRQALPDGGWVAWLEETPEARRAGLHEGVCDFVAVGEKGVQWGHGWRVQRPGRAVA